MQALTWFYLLKGLFSLAATVLMVFHMERAWRESPTLGRRLRYFALLYYSFTSTIVSVDQLHTDPPLDLRAYIGMGGSVIVLLAAAISVAETTR